MGAFLLGEVVVVKLIVRIFLGLTCLFMVGKLALGHNGLVRQMAVSAQNEELRTGNDSLRALLEGMRKQKRRLLKDSAYMEEIARTRFGMSRPGENVYRFLEAQDSVARNDSTQPPGSDEEANQGVTVSRPE